jgi:hypothetical protein
VLRPYGPAPAMMPLFCFNGSAPLRPTGVRAFRIPGVALLKSLVQVTQVLNANTVLPRVAAMRRGFERRAERGIRPDHLDQADLVADLRPVEDLADEYRSGTWSEQLIRESDPSVEQWEKDAVLRVRIARESVEKNSSTDWLAYLLGGAPEPQGSYPVVGLANIRDWDTVRRSPAWKQLEEMEGRGRVDAPTTLDRIDVKLARSLVARGYINSYLVSLFLAPLAEGEVDRLTKLPQRLDRIVGIGGDRIAAGSLESLSPEFGRTV